MVTGTELLAPRRARSGGRGDGAVLVVGVLNVTPDSFSDGGAHGSTDAAVAHGRRLAAQGADVVDVGGESTRPGASRVPVAQEQDRVLPVIERLVADGITVSVDTLNSSTAREAVLAGAEIVNDVSGGLADERMAGVVARTNALLVVSHWRGAADRDHARVAHRDVVDEVRSDLKTRIAALVVEGVDPERIVVDPGLGFGKDASDNWALLDRLEHLGSLGFPVLVGASRKRFLGELVGATPADPRHAERDRVTGIVSALAAKAGAWAVRVHDVPGTRAALDVWDAWRGARR